jgi:hypothetical protein
MTCVELHESLTENESATSAAQRAHLKDCPECAALVSELLVIACAAGDLSEAHEPSARVWNSIQLALKQEGLIRPQGRSLLPSFGSSWGWARWAVPAAALLLVTFGIVVRQNAPSHQVADNTYVAPAATTDRAELQIAGLNDEDLVQEISQQAPALQAEYTENLRHVNQYIQDAKVSIAANPNDEEARRSLMDAYQQKAMLFELAMDRSLP